MILFDLLIGFFLFLPVDALSTTRAPKLQECTAGNCALHDMKLKSFLSTAIETDYTSFLKTSSLSTFTSGNMELGEVISKCGRLFYRGHFKVKYSDAVLICAKRKMQLVTIDGGGKNLNCLAPHFDQMTLEEQENMKYIFIWTSGISEGKNCSNVAYSWCAGSRANIRPADFDLPLEVNRKERCLALSMMTKTLVRMNCNDTNHFYCEFKCKTAICMKKEECIQNKIYFDNNATAKLDRDKLIGVWAEWQKDLGINRMSYTTYIFGYKKITWMENTRLCCSIGMKPVKVTDALLAALNSNSSFSIIYNNQANASDDRELIKTSFWTAATRQGCAGQFRFCLHDELGPWDSTDDFWEMINPRDDGSCLVVDRQYAKEGAPFGVRQVQCSAPTANFACQMENKRIDDLVNAGSNKNNTSLACEQPHCSLGSALCDINKDVALTMERGERVLIKPSRLGEWKTSCGVSFLIHNKDMVWEKAIEFCCTLGMRLLSVQSFEKLACLDRVIPKHGFYWTSATDDKCQNYRFRWCSPEFRDFVKPSVLKNDTAEKYKKYKDSRRYKFEACLKINNSVADGPTLAPVECFENFQPICEARGFGGSHLQEVFNECKSTHRVSQREIDKFNSAGINSFTVKMKCLSTCMAELLGFMYDGGKFWEDVVEKTIKKVKSAEGLEDFRSIVKKYPASLFKKAADNIDALRMMLQEESQKRDWKSTLLVNTALDRFWECNRIVEFKPTKTECSFIYDFIKCFTNGSTLLEKFWNMDLRNLFNPRDYSNSMRIEVGYYEFQDLQRYMKFEGEYLNPDPRTYIDVVNKVSFLKEMVSSPCTFPHFRPQNLTTKDACFEIVEKFDPTPVAGVFMSKIVDYKKLYSPALAATMCARANGSLLSVTESNVADLKILNAILKNITRNLDQVTLAEFLLDETYVDSEGKFRWCSTSQEVYAPDGLDEYSLNALDAFFYYTEEEGTPGYIFGKYISSEFYNVPLVYCKFDMAFISICKQKY
ncbi:uncharacterized protein LOC135936249 isoform X2 [Cloeon dipterum]|uniref:uncharacterized protein LOC135936249 isoform X2 n=1 Tax=Cloeon dipterum TaxID=197152 RepID=UPI0032209FCF